MCSLKLLSMLLIGITLSSEYDELSRGKTAEQSPSRECTYSCEAGLAVDGNISSCMETKVIGGSAPENSMWWRVDLGDTYSISSISIAFKSHGDQYVERDRGRIAGFSLFLSNSSKKENGWMCHKDGPELPPLNFSTDCIGHGRYVIYYNERISFPEKYESNSYNYLCEVTVKGCEKKGVYGSDCNTSCPENCQHQRCHLVNGSCLDCKPGWTGHTCERKCSEGWFGPGCTNQCVGHCVNNDYCNRVSGVCDGGCASGWTGTQCDKECESGMYGINCIHNCSGHCFNNSYCNKISGHCDTGCDPGYIGTFCEESCPPGKFGHFCKDICSGNCVNSMVCNHVDGVCTKGCNDGFLGNTCNKSCDVGYYGSNCSQNCSENCIRPSVCKNTDGSCKCSAGWKGSPNCTIECINSYGEDCQTPCSDYCVNGTCDRISGSCLFGCKGEAYGEKCNQGIVRAYPVSNTASSDMLIAIGVVVPLAVVIIIAVVVILLIRYKRKSSETSAKQKDILNMKHISMVESVNRESSSEHSNLINTDIVHNSEDENERAKRGPPTNECIPVNNLPAIISQMSATDDIGFQHEYQDIPNGELHPCEEAKRPENKSKNRYTTTFPYDHSRVILKTSSSNEGDYINANYIEDVQGRRSYIATQGPMPKTIADFWKMIWQEDVSIIVCLTNLKEGAKIKCSQYWPNINDKLQDGGFNVRSMEEKVYANYTKRHFKVYNLLDQKDREVVMFHYTRWPDHGVPAPLSLVVFHRHVMRVSTKHTGKYIAVHCSAGIGRTGTYIALDALYREGEINGKVNVPMYVRTMRKDRMNMIQGDEQYKIVYLLLNESFLGKSRCMTTEQIVQGSQDNVCYANCADVTSNPLSSDFKELMSVRKTYIEEDFESGSINIEANYSKYVLPVEEFMCRLTYSEGRSTYYNAVFLQSYKENDSLISAQYPLHEYTEDFLRLIMDMNVHVVVFLCPLSDLESFSLWIPSKNMKKTVGNFTVKLNSCEESPQVSKTNILLKPKGCSSLRVTVLGCPKWKEGLTSADKRDLVEVVKAAKSESLDHGNRLLVLSSDGATRCGSFCVVYNALEQLSMDQEVDIFTITRQLQIRRPEFVSTLEEYQLCHEAVAEYLRNDSVYANF